MDCIILFAWVGFLVHAFSFLIGLLYNRCRKLVFVALGGDVFFCLVKIFPGRKKSFAIYSFIAGNVLLLF